MKRRFLPAILLLLVTASHHDAAPAVPESAKRRPVSVRGSVRYRTGPKRTVTVDAHAKVWVFQGREDLALRSLEKLKQFEVQFPQGLTRIEDRPKEEETRMSAMVLMTYSSVHQQSLLKTVPLGVDGAFQFTWDGKTPLTVIVESAETMGSYHMPRYAVTTVDPKQPLRPLVFDFGVSHMESHPPMPGNENEKDEAVKG
jgi:hypothetical protein